MREKSERTNKSYRPDMFFAKPQKVGIVSFLAKKRLEVVAGVLDEIEVIGQKRFFFHGGEFLFGVYVGWEIVDITDFLKSVMSVQSNFKNFISNYSFSSKKVN
ncbi:hypothetical protein [Flavobacterium selenitireducens]|uniref:hypothetical protein n=1 Tax=Flavobacterium selenitireducens TaxID=2722704 RepID=UPI00168B6E95|nr:hypothetical protein [Flavobacterium selenitireducens]MBD3582321.1 hypothetical protein [Flavobacterium selenitireducens]